MTVKKELEQYISRLTAFCQHDMRYKIQDHILQIFPSGGKAFFFEYDYDNSIVLLYQDKQLVSKHQYNDAQEAQLNLSYIIFRGLCKGSNKERSDYDAIAGLFMRSAMKDGYGMISETLEDSYRERLYVKKEEQFFRVIYYNELCGEHNEYLLSKYESAKDAYLDYCRYRDFLDDFWKSIRRYEMLFSVRLGREASLKLLGFRRKAVKCG